MTISNIRFLMIVVLAVFVTACGGTAETASTPASTQDADNTARNDRDKTEAAKTPLDQGENAADLEVSANIRKAILADDALSSNAHNVKIITSGGVVTLRGPVKSAQEKMTVETKARQVAGVTRVESLLEVEAN